MCDEQVVLGLLLVLDASENSPVGTRNEASDAAVVAVGENQSAVSVQFAFEETLAAPECSSAKP